MVKSLKVFSILFTIAWSAVIFLLVMTSLRQPEFGKLIVDGYEELTNEFGHTVTGMYVRLANYLQWIVVILFGLTVLVLVIHIKAIKYVFLGLEDMTADEIAAEKEVDAVVKSGKERREAKAKLRAEKLAKKIKKEEQLLAVEKTVDAVDKAVSASDKAVNTFLDSLRTLRK